MRILAALSCALLWVASLHGQTFSGAAAVDQALSDPLWGRTFDLASEAEVAALARARQPSTKEARWTLMCSG